MIREPKKRYVLVFYTGGTIGMTESDQGLVPAKGYLEKQMREDPWLMDSKYTFTQEDKAKMPVYADGKQLSPLAMKETEDGCRVVYGIWEFVKLLDSSNISMDDWVLMAEHVERHYDNFDGFVILHGTDTMAFTSSALAFMLKDTKKGIVVTGSQVPLFQLRTDAEQNLKGALIMAGQFGYEIPEVSLLFYNTLYRGCRTSKVNASGFQAFNSPNFKPLATIGVDFNVPVNWMYIFKPEGPFTVYKKMSSAVGILRLFPGITKETVSNFFKDLKGAVLQTFGAGNSPDDIVSVLKKATSGTLNGTKVLILNITQCLQGSVQAIYATGNQLIEAGVVPGSDMTPEAGLTKVSFLVERNDLTYKEKQELLQVSLEGELTSDWKSV